MKTIALNDTNVELVDRLYTDLFVSKAEGAEIFYLNSLGYARKVEKLLKYLESIEKELHDEKFNIT
jgi:hypothetical protein